MKTFLIMALLLGGCARPAVQPSRGSSTSPPAQVEPGADGDAGGSYHMARPVDDCGMTGVWMRDGTEEADDLPFHYVMIASQTNAEASAARRHWAKHDGPDSSRLPLLLEADSSSFTVNLAPQKREVDPSIRGTSAYSCRSGPCAVLTCTTSAQQIFSMHRLDMDKLHFTIRGGFVTPPDAPVTGIVTIDPSREANWRGRLEALGLKLQGESESSGLMRLIFRSTHAGMLRAADLGFVLKIEGIDREYLQGS